LEHTLVRSASGNRITGSQLLRQPETTIRQLSESVVLESDPAAGALDLASVEVAVKYAGYLRRQEREVESAHRHERRRIPTDFNFTEVPGLSREVVQRLNQVRPDTLGHALRIPGITPAAIAVLSAFVGRADSPVR
jgi:tRNA uridine 5-carboxymethylaminomethyl modification enzyme